MLPSLVPLALKNETAQFIEPELNVRMKKLKHLIDSGVISQDTSQGLQIFPYMRRVSFGKDLTR